MLVLSAADVRLFDAVQRRDEKAVLGLLSSGAKVNEARDDGSTPLAWAVNRDDSEITAALLRAGANVNAADENGETPLLLDDANGNLEIARHIIYAGADVHAKSWNGHTPLISATSAGNIELVRLLLDKGAAVNIAESRMSQTPLMFAIADGRSDISKLLIDRGADVNAVSTNGFTPLLFAALRGDDISARSLIAAKADPKYKAKDGSTAFTIALARGNDAVTRLMLEQGADPSARDAAGATPLHEAARQGKLEDLIARGADVNAKVERAGGRGGAPPGGLGQGQTPFLIAALSGKVELMQELLKLGADPKALAVDGTGAVLLATNSRNLDAVKMVVELGLDVNQHPNNRPTALHQAVKFGSNDIVEYLAAHGADFTAKDNFGRNALEEAEFEAPSSTIELMKKLTAAKKP